MNKRQSLPNIHLHYNQIIKSSTFKLPFFNKKSINSFKDISISPIHSNNNNDLSLSKPIDKHISSSFIDKKKSRYGQHSCDKNSCLFDYNNFKLLSDELNYYKSHNYFSKKSLFKLNNIYVDKLLDLVKQYNYDITIYNFESNFNKYNLSMKDLMKFIIKN